MIDIDTDNAFDVFLIVIAILAIAMVAATITSVTSPTGDDGSIRVDVVGPIEDRQGGVNDTQGNGSGTGSIDNSEGGLQLTYCIEFLTTPLAIGGMVAGIMIVLYGVYRSFNLATSLFASFLVAPMVFGSWAVLTNCVSGSSGTGNILDGSTILNPGGSGVVTAPPVSPTVIAVVFASLVVVSLVLMLTATGTDQEYEPIDNEEDEDLDEAAFARAAGRAADRIEEGNVAVDNAVYRAWREMTNLLSIPDPETSAPMDFADAAIEFGLDENDVRELAELFNEVRYGHKSPERREERAIEILRRIETTYEERTENIQKEEGE